MFCLNQNPGWLVIRCDDLARDARVHVVRGPRCCEPSMVVCRCTTLILRTSLTEGDVDRAGAQRARLATIASQHAPPATPAPAFPDEPAAPRVSTPVPGPESKRILQQMDARQETR